MVDRIKRSAHFQGSYPCAGRTTRNENASDPGVPNSFGLFSGQVVNRTYTLNHWCGIPLGPRRGAKRVLDDCLAITHQAEGVEHSVRQHIQVVAPFERTDDLAGAQFVRHAQ